MAVCPGFNVTGNVPARTEKPVPVMAVEFTVTAVVPVELNVNVCVVAVFTATSPKSRLVALTLSLGFDAATPVPLSATVEVLPVVESLLIVNCPLSVAADGGLNCICSVTDWPGVDVMGKLLATIVKPVPVIEAEFTVRSDVPEEVSVTVLVVGVFTVTLPYERLVGFTVI